MHAARRFSKLFLLAGGVLAAAPACRDDTQSPTSPSSEPALAAAATGALAFRQVSAGSWHACGVTTDDRAY